jgi:hypothetical protein
MKSACVAFLIAPLIPGIIWASLVSGPVILLFAVPIGYVGAAFGLPLYLLVRHFWRVSLLSCIVGGAVAGALTMVAFSVWNGSSVELSVWFARGVLLFALFGAVAGAAFYGLERGFSGKTKNHGTNA